MSNSLVARLDKLEASVRVKEVIHPKVLRLVVKEGGEREAHRQAVEMGLDTSPGSRDFLIVRVLTAARNDGRNPVSHLDSPFS